MERKMAILFYLQADDLFIYVCAVVYAYIDNNVSKYEKCSLPSHTHAAFYRARLGKPDINDNTKD